MHQLLAPSLLQSRKPQRASDVDRNTLILRWIQTKAAGGARIGRHLQRANSIDVDPRLTLLDPRGKL
jgi:hypothetical protein